MSIAQRYQQDGYVHLRQFIPVPVAQAFLHQLDGDLQEMGADWTRLEKAQPLLARPAAEVYGFHYAPLITFLWGMTPAISLLLGRELLPTYSYFRLYRAGDVCHVHSDRPSCEHSLSLTLAYSEEKPWALEMGARHLAQPQSGIANGFGDEPFSAVSMRPGGAVLYQGVHRRHGRTTPNPNRWSAHLFLHWVDPAGPYAAHAFDGRTLPPASDLRF